MTGDELHNQELSQFTFHIPDIPRSSHLSNAKALIEKTYRDLVGSRFGKNTKNNIKDESCRLFP